MKGMETNLTHTYTQVTKEKNSKLWCCANSAIELVDTVKKTNKQIHKHNKRIKQLPETTQQMVVEIFLQKN